MNRVRIRKHSPGVYVGALTLGCPGADGVGDMDGNAVITVGAFGSSQADALHKAALIAERIANDPIMAAILPPQARAAIVATKKLASAAKRGSRFFRHMWKRFNGPGIQRVARALHDEAMKNEGHTDAEVAGFWSRVKHIAKKAAKYGTVPGLIYTAAKAARRKKRKRAITPPPEAPQQEDEQPEDEQPEPPQPEAPQSEPANDNDMDDMDDMPGGVDVEESDDQ